MNECPLPVAKKVVARAEYVKMLARDRVPDGKKVHVPSWVLRYQERYIGPTCATWALGLNYNLLKYARMFYDGPPCIVGNTKKKPRLYYKLRDIIAWAVERRLRLKQQPPYYIVNKYSWPAPPQGESNATATLPAENIS